MKIFALSITIAEEMGLNGKTKEKKNVPKVLWKLLSKGGVFEKLRHFSGMRIKGTERPRRVHYGHGRNPEEWFQDLLGPSKMQDQQSCWLHGYVAPEEHFPSSTPFLLQIAMAVWSCISWGAAIVAGVPSHKELSQWDFWTNLQHSLHLLQDPATAKPLPGEIMKQ